MKWGIFPIKMGEMPHFALAERALSNMHKIINKFKLLIFLKITKILRNAIFRGIPIANL